MPTEKVPTSFRLSDEARDLIQRLTEVLGINQTAVVEQAVRKLARQELADAEPAKPTAKKTRRK
jgi:predicted transcriptional regulator